MKLTVHTTDGTHLEVKDFEQVSAMALLADLENGDTDRMLRFDLDTGPCLIAAAHVVRVDLEFEPDSDSTTVPGA